MICVVKLLHMVTLIFFTVSVYKVCVQSETARESNALAVVPGQELEDDGVVVEIESSEIEYDPNLVFYPTKEWQTVKTNQAIPAGLHVRLNLQTGEKEAKLMEGDDGMKYWQQGDKQGIVNPKSKSFTHDELKEALKEFKAEADDEETTRRREASIKKKFQKYKDLKKDLESLNLSIKTDGEIIATMVEKLKLEETEEKDKLALLINLEYYLHQIDNAVMFCAMGGMPPLSHLLNHTVSEIRAAAAHVIGSATQSNPTVQVQAVESGALPQLIRLLSTDKHLTVRRRCLYAISSIVRHFPIAQQKLVQLGGVTVLLELFKEPGTEKLQEKTVTLLNDLLLEQEHIEEMDREDSNVQMRKAQYKEVPLLDMMLDLGWCDLIPNLLHITDHEVREKVITAMFSVRQKCSMNFSTYLSLLKQLQGEYKELSREEMNEDSPDDLYFTAILEKINSIVLKVTQKEEL